MRDAPAADPVHDDPRGATLRPPGWRPPWMPVIAVGCGGALGATLRYQAGVWAADRWGERFPWGTLLVNVAGCLLLGIFLTVMTERVAGRPATRLFVATGLLGGFTTFSTFAYETVRLFEHGRVATGLAYLGASLLLGLAATAGGIVAARAL